MDILDFIPIGREYAITRRELTRKTNMSDRKVRACIAAAREQGWPIVARQDGGYYMAETEEDKQALLGELMSRMKKLSACYNAVRKRRMEA